MDNYKWNDNNSNRTLPSVVVLMISRNKDNKDVINFKERRSSFFRTFDYKKIHKRFEHFVEDGVPGEMCRLYISLNPRDTIGIRIQMLHMLIDKDDFNFDYIEVTVAGIAAQKEYALTKKWFFDFDSLDEDELEKFLVDIDAISPDVFEKMHRTPHGYAVVVSHGFDTRELLDKWNGIATLKRDDLICYDWRTKE